MCQDFVSKVNPENVSDHLIQNKIVNLKQKRNLTNEKTTEGQCQALLDILISCSKENAFVILRDALREHYREIVEHIDAAATDDKDQNNSNRGK